MAERLRVLRGKLDTEYTEALEKGLREADPDEGLDLPTFTRAWVKENVGKCRKVALGLFAEALAHKGRRHIKRPVGKQLGLPGFEHLGNVIPVGLSVPTEDGPRYFALTRISVGKAKEAREALVAGAAADMVRADALFTLIQRRTVAGAGDEEPLIPPPPRPDIPPRPTGEGPRPEA